MHAFNVEIDSILFPHFDAVFYITSRLAPPTVAPPKLSALRFFESRSFQSSVGREEHIGMAQYAVSNTIHEVTEAIIPFAARRKLVDFQRIPAAENNAMAAFAEHGYIPGVLACVDGTLVAIRKPQGRGIRDTTGFRRRFITPSTSWFWCPRMKAQARATAGELQPGTPVLPSRASLQVSARDMEGTSGVQLRAELRDVGFRQADALEQQLVAETRRQREASEREEGQLAEAVRELRSIGELARALTASLPRRPAQE
ncbi:hypothetical protein HPB50_009171 [Hyalomma asiaticum]|uniref:Uncharacterized protein n=1 Tax=Hyalomma asiaticum TaxID=266040 RepID=A0ACB7SWZ4_HYAAI|nr:hypothetical protein HPB50_009171 [Hyalomma asiaticum]